MSLNKQLIDNNESIKKDINQELLINKNLIKYNLYCISCFNDNVWKNKLYLSSINPEIISIENAEKLENYDKVVIERDYYKDELRLTNQKINEKKINKCSDFACNPDDDVV